MAPLPVVERVIIAVSQGAARSSALAVSRRRHTVVLEPENNGARDRSRAPSFLPSDRPTVRLSDRQSASTSSGNGLGTAPGTGSGGGGGGWNPSGGSISMSWYR